MILIIVNQGPVILSLLATFFVFLCIGMFQLLIFQKSKKKTGKLYGADLTGAAFGSVAAFLLLNLAGGLLASVIASLVISFSCMLIYFSIYNNKTGWLLNIILLISVFSIVIIFSLSIQIMPKNSLMKEMTIMLNDTDKDPVITETHWSSFGRVDLVETNNPLFKTMFIDGAAGTKMINMESGQVSRDIADTLLYQYMGGIPLLAVENTNKENALIIGSGGGIDVVTVLLAGYQNIDAVEINPDFIKIAKNYNTYNGRIYTANPQVTLIEGEGRSFIRSSSKKYNLILMSLPITKSARNYGNQALTENYLFTYNAFTEYFDSLENQGFLVIVAHYPNELMKLAVNAIAAFEKQGVSVENAMKRIITIGNDSSPSLIIKNEPFTRDEVESYYEIMDILELRGNTNFIPDMPQQTNITKDSRGISHTVYEFNPGLYDIAHGYQNLEQLIETNSESIGRVSDNSPFFYQMSKNLPSEIVIVSILTALFLIIIFILFLLKGKFPSSLPLSSISIMQFISFGSIGVGYMLIEIAFLQQFILYWQHQTLALAIVLSIILISSGAGSLLSANFTSRRNFSAALGILLIILISGSFLTDFFLKVTSNSGSVYKFFITIIAVMPTFFIMGMFFPILLERNELVRKSRAEYSWMIGFNSLASLFGGVFSMVIALSAGYNWVMILGIAAYALLGLITIIHDRILKKKSSI